MFFIKRKFKKQIVSLLLTTVMTASAFDFMSVKTTADETNAYEVTADAQQGAVEVKDFSVSKPSGTGINEFVTLEATAQSGSGQYEYRFGTIYNGVTYYSSKDGVYSDSNSTYIPLYGIANNNNPDSYMITPGNNTLFAEVKDKVTGTTARKTIENYVIEGMKVSDLRVTTENGKFEKGKSINLSVDVENEAGYRYNTRMFYYSYNDGDFVYIDPHGPGNWYSINFTPDKEGKYTFKYHIADFVGQKVTTKTVDVYVGGKQAVVYYDNSSWNNANIHYCVDGRSWTDVPGVQMQASDIEGYAWKYVINLENSNGASVCFNNGNNWWDSQNGNNYRVGEGVYAIKNGQVTDISLSATMEFVGSVGAKSALVTMSNGTGPYTIEYKAYKDNELQYSSTAHTYGDSDHAYLSFSLYYEGLYRVDATITDANGQVCTVSHEEYFPGLIINLTPDKDEYKVGEEVTITCSFENFFYYKFPPMTYWYVTKDGVNVPSTQSGNELKFTPTEAGTYTITYDIPNYQLGAQSKSITINVKDDNNKVVVYYNNSNWANANIHYGINGSWTNVPGVAMQSSDNPRYTWKYVIDLGDASSVQVCFNNGNGSWDSRNGANYTLTAGSYSIVNGIIYNA